jgi:hypothetical protein
MMRATLSLLAALAAALWLPAHAQDDCVVPQAINAGSTPIWTPLHVSKSGRYCLERSVKAPRIGGLFGERDSPYGAMLQIEASNVAFDLRGFSIDVEPINMRGVASGYWLDPSQQRRITVRNGSIHSRGGEAIAFSAPPRGSLLADFQAVYESVNPRGGAFNRDAAAGAYKELIDMLPKTAADYQETAHLLESLMLVVEFGGRNACLQCAAIRMKGASNTIRNSTIEIDDGHAAIYLFGPNQIIENNIIVFKGRAALASAAAIILHQGDGTIIRNNDIIIQSTGEEAPQAAIALIDSKNVLVEGNRVYGVSTLTRAWDERSSAIDRNNDFRSLLRRPWATAEPGVH